MSLLDDLRNLLTRHARHVESLTNQGTLRPIEDHLARLSAVAGDLTAAEEAAHKVLDELYAALNAPAPAVEPAPAAPAAPVETPVPAAAPVETEPVPAPEPATDPAPADQPAETAA